MKTLDEIKLSFTDEIKKNGGNIYVVGGTIRDLYLNKPSKDLDIVITGIELNKLKTILSKYGNVEIVGESFGVIKFTDNKTGEIIDVALPRKEIPNGVGGYKGFDVNVDHTLPITTDLERRDTKLNSMAYDLINRKLIDPFNGLNDINNKIISATSNQSFIDDPLRMLRAVAQAARFGFKIDPETFKMIQLNAPKIKEITWERILIELQKIVDKGQPVVGAQLLVSSNLFENIFDNKFIGTLKPFGFVKKMSEFVYWLIQGFVPKPSEFYKKVMKGDIKTTAEIKALELVMGQPVRTDLEDKWMVFNVNKTAPSMLDSYFIMNELDNVIFDFTKKYPISYKQLAVNGTDLEGQGFKNEKVGLGLRLAMDAVYSDTVANDKSQLLQYVSGKINENIIIKKEIILEMTEPQETVHFFDFDGTIMDSPLPETGKDIYAQVTGKKYPHIGWWGRPESLDLNVFDIQPKADIESIYRKVIQSSHDHAVLLTNRQLKLGDLVKKVLDKHQMPFEHYSYKHNNDEKGDRILQIMKQFYPGVKNIIFYDDDQRHLDNAEMVLEGTDYNLKTVKISSDLDYQTQNDEKIK